MQKYWILLVLFILLSLYVKIIGENFPLNVYFFQLINYHQYTPLNPLMIFFAKYGREYIWIPLTAILLIFRKTRRVAITLAVSFIFAIILGEVTKYLMAEPRPFDFIHPDYLLLPKPTDYSYPSGHALIVSDGAIVLALTINDTYRWLWIIMMIEALIVSYARVYVGVHWPVDILGGWLLGGWIAYFTVNVEKRGFLSLVERVFKA